MLKWNTTAALAATIAFSSAALLHAQEAPAADPVEPAVQPAEPAAEPVPELAPEVKAVLDQLDAAGADLEDMKASLTYEETIPLLDKTTRSRGKLQFKKPAKIALRLGKPHKEDVYTDGKVWWAVSHTDKQVQKFVTSGDDLKDAPEAAFLKFGFGEGAGELAKEYAITLDKTLKPEDEGDPTVYTLTFKPRPRKDEPLRYQSITVELADNLWLPQVVRLEETGGEIVHVYRFSKIQRNAGVDDETFDYSPPRGYTVVEPQNQ